MRRIAAVGMSILWLTLGAARAEDQAAEPVTSNREYLVTFVAFEMKPELLPQLAEAAGLPTENSIDLGADRDDVLKVVERSAATQMIESHGGKLAAKVAQLKQDQQIQVIASDKLSVSENQIGKMRAGGEFPILIPKEKGKTAIVFREFGVKATARVTRLDDARLRVDVAVLAQDRDFANATKANGIVIPGLVSRRFHVTNELRPRQGAIFSTAQPDGQLSCILVSVEE